MHHLLKGYLHWHCTNVIVVVLISHCICLIPNRGHLEQTPIQIQKTVPELADQLEFQSDRSLLHLSPVLRFIFYVDLRQQFQSLGFGFFPGKKDQ